MSSEPVTRQKVVVATTVALMRNEVFTTAAAAGPAAAKETMIAATQSRPLYISNLAPQPYARTNFLNGRGQQAALYSNGSSRPRDAPAQISLPAGP